MTDDVSVVHNGIIENFRELKQELVAEGARFTSDTDTEVIAQLITRERREGKDPVQAVFHALKHVEGAFALAMIFKGDDNLMVVARQGSPLAIGYGGGEMFVGSDALALAPFTNSICLSGGRRLGGVDARGRRHPRPQRPGGGAARHQVFGHRAPRRPRQLPPLHGEGDPRTAGGRRPYARKSRRSFHQQAWSCRKLPINFATLPRLSISACGTAFYAGLVAKYWFERFARLPVDVDIASEFRYREGGLVPGGGALFISQSGETADTLATLRYCRAEGQSTLAVVNVRESSIAREAGGIIPTLAGPEIGVASTKAFTCQLTVLACLAIAAGKARGHIDAKQEAELVQALAEMPRHMASVLRDESPYEKLAQSLSKARDVLYLGRGSSYPLAMEGALKLKEISYIHAEGYAAGELKHGPIALIDENLPVIVIAPRDDLYDKTVSNMQEVAARGGQIILVSDADPSSTGCNVHTHLKMPPLHRFVTPLLYALPVQLIAYHTAVFMGTDVDQPRNLAKSVTVE